MGILPAVAPPPKTPPSPLQALRELAVDVFDPRRFPWIYLGIFLVSGVITGFPTLRQVFVYHRAEIASGELWRIWTGHLVHFGWVHYLADGLLFMVIGWALERSQRGYGRLSLLLLPVAVSGAVFFFDPKMTVYGGLSGVNVGLLIFLACRGWQHDLLDWFWPAVLGIHVLELWLEARNKGVGGGAIRFDDPTIRVATIAHVGGVVYGLGMWAVLFVQRHKHRPPGKTPPAESPAGS